MLRHMDRVISKSEEVDTVRINNLSNFQLSILKKAVSFPSVHTIVYSTCSVHKTENEDVVARFLIENRLYGWSVESPIRFIGWRRRGLPHDDLSTEESDALIRCDGEDGMNGFFVALFRKNTPSESISDARLIYEKEFVEHDESMCRGDSISDKDDDYKYGRNEGILHEEKTATNNTNQITSSRSNSSEDYASSVEKVYGKRSSSFLTGDNCKIKRKKAEKFWRPISNTGGNYCK